MSWADTQRQFFTALKGDESAIAVPERMAIYRRNVQLTLVDSLAETYRAVRALVGEEYFAKLADEYATDYWPQSGNLTGYGAHFAGFIAAGDVADYLPYLPDVARYEWAWQSAYFAPEAKTEAWQERPQELLLRSQFVFHPSVQALAVHYDADAIWRYCVLENGEGEAPGIEPSRCYYLLHRNDEGVYCEILDEKLHGAITSLMQGSALQQALATLPPDKLEPFTTLLFTSGWVINTEQKEKTP